jgi:hypothetical protein
MKNLIKEIKCKINGLIITLTATGLFLLILSILVVWTKFVLELLIGLIILSIAYVFFYMAYKLWHMKKAIEKFTKF